MLIRNEILRLKSLHSPKGRKAENTVLIEGLRLVEDCLESQWPAKKFFIVETNLEKPQYQSTINLAKSLGLSITEISNKDMVRISDTKNPQGVAMEIEIQEQRQEIQLWDKILYLDGISDPGNLGTIMRTAIWFGIEQILLSENCANIWNSKVLRSAMGAHFKLNLEIFNLADLFNHENQIPHTVIGACMDGSPLDNLDINNENWILVLGNEARGISPEILSHINKKVTINGSGKQESLNVAVAGGIILNSLNKEN